ncbi:hypothetical protein MTR_8g039330 [Medicago truncatula]|uniref:HD-Zip IV C-terminal domain-containing protein n=1 Tax=Medicago truncatula TaxID=3880 RepID=G7LG35_MEDTR|nr:hypothetical protein MTR_8g039330 [Medicago truncatula]
MKSVLKLPHIMVTMFCKCLTMSSSLEFPNLIQDIKPTCIVVAGAATLWIPLSAEKVFKFLTNPTQRFKVH